MDNNLTSKGERLQFSIDKSQVNEMAAATARMDETPATEWQHAHMQFVLCPAAKDILTNFILKRYIEVDTHTDIYIQVYIGSYDNVCVCVSADN